MIHFSKKTILLLLLSLLAQFVLAGDISKIELTGINDNRIIKIKFNGSVVFPKIIAKKHALQVNLSFEGAKSLIDRNILEYHDSVLSHITLSELGNTTQVMVRMKKNATYKLNQKGNEIWLYIDPNNTGKEVAKKDKDIHDKVAEQIPPLHTDKTLTYGTLRGNENPIHLDFRRTKNGNGSVVLIVSDQHQSPQIKKFNHELQLVLRNYRPFSEDQNTYDVTEFDTLIRKIDIVRQGNDAIITIYTNEGNWDY